MSGTVRPCSEVRLFYYISTVVWWYKPESYSDNYMVQMIFFELSQLNKV